MRESLRVGCSLLIGASLAAATGATPPPPVVPNPVIFVTQVPIPADASKTKFQPNPVTATFGNGDPAPRWAGRGGDLYLMMPDGSLRNLTFAAGFGNGGGAQGAGSIAVRDPCVSFDAKKALFSMVVGAPTSASPNVVTHWQLYEVTNLDSVIASNATPTIAAVPHQPASQNNFGGCYANDGRIVFISDLQPNGAHLAPQLDEYVVQPTNSGLWSMDPSDPSGDLQLLDASPSGDFSPFVDGAGRVIFTRWDHLQRDALADQDFAKPGSPPNGAFNWNMEDVGGVPVADTTEFFPAPQSGRPDLLQPSENAFEFNFFFPWMVNQDGSGMETIDHIGRHELVPIVGPSFSNDPNLVPAFYVNVPGKPLTARTNQHWITSLFEIHERPTGSPGFFVGVDAPETGTQGAGQIVVMPGPDGGNADTFDLTWVTAQDTKTPSNSPTACHSGFYRNPLPLSDGTIIAAHAGLNASNQPETRVTADESADSTHPISRYHFRLVTLVNDATAGCTAYKKYASGHLTDGATSSLGIQKSLSFWNGTADVVYTNVTMWELEPVEVVSRTPPPTPTGALPGIESGVFTATGVDQNAFHQYLLDHDLALIVSRNVTTRDAADKQQPWKLVVQQPGGVQTPPAPTSGTVYPVKYLQIFQGDLVRGYGGAATPQPGRRTLPRPLHDGGPHPPPSDQDAPPGSVEIEADGSFAAIVPAHRALSWQLVDDAGAPKVRERYWVNFGRGEMRVCTSCHGINTHDQTGASAPQTTPLALTKLLTYWKSWLFSDDFEVLLKKWSAYAP